MSEVHTALIVEDDEDLATIFAEALRAAGYVTEMIASGDSAMARLGASTPNVVVLDLHLPKIAGTGILRQVRSDIRLSGTRVVIVTADARMAETTRDAADLVLVKPISFGLLRDLTARFKVDSQPKV